MKTLKLTEIQLKEYVKYLKEEISTLSSTSTYGTSSNSSSNNKGSVVLKKQNVNPNDIKKYTDKGINVSIVNEEDEDKKA